MVVNQISSQNFTKLPAKALESLHRLLEKMNVCADKLESIAQSEYEAIRQLDAGQIMLMSEHRITVHQCLGQLEHECRQLLLRYEVSSDLALSVVIDMYAGAEASEFQALRRNLYDRMLKVDQHNQENRLRLHAAYNVSTSILQGLGLSQSEHTYKRRTTG